MCVVSIQFYHCVLSLDLINNASQECVIFDYANNILKSESIVFVLINQYSLSS